MPTFTAMESELIDRIRAQDQEFAALKKGIKGELQSLIVMINVYGNSKDSIDMEVDDIRTELRRIIKDVLHEPNGL